MNIEFLSKEDLLHELKELNELNMYLSETELEIVNIRSRINRSLDKIYRQIIIMKG